MPSASTTSILTQILESFNVHMYFMTTVWACGLQEEKIHAPVVAREYTEKIKISKYLKNIHVRSKYFLRKNRRYCFVAIVENLFLCFVTTQKTQKNSKKPKRKKTWTSSSLKVLSRSPSNTRRQKIQELTKSSQSSQA